MKAQGSRFPPGSEEDDEEDEGEGADEGVGEDPGMVGAEAWSQCPRSHDHVTHAHPKGRRAMRSRTPLPAIAIAVSSSRSRCASDWPPPCLCRCAVAGRCESPVGIAPYPTLWITITGPRNNSAALDKTALEFEKTIAGLFLAAGKVQPCETIATLVTREVRVTLQDHDNQHAFVRTSRGFNCTCSSQNALATERSSNSPLRPPAVRIVIVRCGRVQSNERNVARFAIGHFPGTVESERHRFRESAFIGA